MELVINRLSINGTFKYLEDRNNMVKPIALDQYLLNHSNIKGIHPYFDNDQIG